MRGQDRLLLKCVDTASAAQLADAVTKLRAERSHYTSRAKYSSESQVVSERAYVEVSVDDYFPRELLVLLDDIQATPLGMISVSNQIILIIQAYLRAFGDPRVFNIQPAIRSDLKSDDRSFNIDVTVMNWGQIRDGMLQQHQRLVMFLKEVERTATREKIDVISVTGDATTLHALRASNEIRLTGAAMLTVAVLAVVSRKGWFPTREFCSLRYPENQPEPDTAFDTPVRYLSRSLPTLKWQSDHKGNRQLRGVVFQPDVEERDLRAYIAAKLRKRPTSI